MIAFRNESRAIFLFGFAKNARDNVSDEELRVKKALGASWLALPQTKIDEAIKDKQLIEVEHDDDDDEG